MISLYNLAVVAIELLIVLVTFIALQWVLNWLFKKSAQLSWFQDKKNQFNRIRKLSKRLLAFAWLLLSLAIVLFNAFLIYRGEQNLWDSDRW